MSTQWEVVGKPKKSKSGVEQPKNSKSMKKAAEKFYENSPKIEDLIPFAQIKTLYSNLDKSSNKENKKPNPVQETVKKPAAKPVTKPANNDNKKPQPPSKPKVKSLEAGLTSISSDELITLLETLKLNFKDSNLVWLKALSSFLNSNLNIETDPIFASKSINYPSNVIPVALKTIIFDELRNCGLSSIQYFYDLSLTILTDDMSKNLPYLGHKIMLQLVAQEWPSVCISNLAKCAILRNSYQNRSAIGLTLFWALGQGGYQDLSVGLKVWLNFMLPLLDLKSYSKFICEYIHRVLTTTKIDETGINISPDEFIKIFEALTQQRNGFNREYQKLFQESAVILMEKYTETISKDSSPELFSGLFKKISTSTDSGLVCSGLRKLIGKNDECINVWKTAYKKNIGTSAVLLNYLCDSDMSDSFKKNKNFKEFLSHVAVVNEDISQGNKRNDGVKETNRILVNLQEKMSKQKKSSDGSCGKCCKWTFGIIFLGALITGLIAYDTNTNGGGVFEKSATGKFLEKTGTLPYVMTGWTTTMKYGARGYQWTEERVPVAYEKTTKVLGPYCEFTKDFGKIVLNTACKTWNNTKTIVAAKTPIVVNFVEQYAPGLPKKVEDLSISGWKATLNVYQSGCDFFKTKVFIGNLSPKSLSQALNQTQIAAAKYYSWFHDKVDTYAKLK